jgi:hypothetical protein
MIRRKASSSSTSAALLVLGVVIGAGLIFGTLYASGSLGQRTLVRTTTQVLTTTQTSTTSLFIVAVTSLQSAQVSAQVTQCSHNANGTDSCTVTLTNSGTANTAATACFLSVSGVATQGTLTGPAKTSIPASASATGACRVTAAAQTVGSQAVGSFSLSNGGSVPFSGTWS